MSKKTKNKQTNKKKPGKLEWMNRLPQTQICMGGYLLLRRWWGWRSAFHKPVRWGIVLIAPLFPTPLGSGVQIRQMFCGAYTQQLNKKAAKYEIWGLGRESDQIRSCVSTACAGMHARPCIHKHALCSPPPASCFWAHEITIMHLSVLGINISLLLKFVCRRHIPVACDKHPFRYHLQSPLILYTLFNFNGYLICVISLQGSK